MKLNSKDVLNISPIVPVIALDNLEDALPLAKALQDGGINIMEITLRTKTGLKAIELISKEMPSMNVGAGTVCNAKDLEESIAHGAAFIFSPGISEELIKSAKQHDIALIPGVSTASEVMLAQNNDLFACKLFPAVQVGGVSILKAFSGPFPKMNFCPTGGVSLDNMNDFLSLNNVLCVGGSWLVPKYLLEEKNFSKITEIAKNSLERINSLKA
jgi:2-dehydro-3-deoxyphosphogluconate aldolase/(4S)-4-hydroxy-2-oxoglutarate aldolase